MARITILPTHIAPDAGIDYRIHLRNEVVSQTQPQLRVPMACAICKLQHYPARDFKGDGLSMNALKGDCLVLVCKWEVPT